MPKGSGWEIFHSKNCINLRINTDADVVAKS